VCRGGQKKKKESLPATLSFPAWPKHFACLLPREAAQHMTIIIAISGLAGFSGVGVGVGFGG
jgi:hypothetical protein